MSAKTPVTDELVTEMVNAIVDEVHPERVILFGSRARGNEREDSDVDLLVVEAEPFDAARSRHKELSKLYRALAGFRVPADVLVYSQDDVDYWRDSLNHVLARGLREGKVLYDREWATARATRSRPSGEQSPVPAPARPWD